MPVHLYGQLAPMEPLNLLAKRYDLRVIEDAAQAIGATYTSHRAESIGAKYCGSAVRVAPNELNERNELHELNEPNEPGCCAMNAGSLGDFGCFSFFPTKNLGAYGDGGMITTNNDAYAEKLRLLRVHGARPKYFHQIVGTNSRLDSLQAAILRVKLPHLDEWIAAQAG